MAEAGNGVYTATTVPKEEKGERTCVWLQHPEMPRFALKALELVCSAIAFICEEIVEHCLNCGTLYFFEFMSCTASLLTIVVLVVYCTKLAEKITLEKLMCWDLWWTGITGILFLISSIAFLSTSYNAPLERTSGVFGILASIVFLVDFGCLLRRGVRPLSYNKTTKQPEENQHGEAAESEQLRASSPDQP
ncbi:CKLF-like MARVEL transmembrane domain-containing protein 6 [Ambystoma mexicanum]|uniref:CKLF-like MARVEL transmembrane domain-containing protein 6 n=1 Tax=Ambystoma mexicanum TaxID=8296 RepID=UPI0037E90D8E